MVSFPCMLCKLFVYLGDYKNKTIDYALENTKGLVESSLLYFPLSNGKYISTL